MSESTARGLALLPRALPRDATTAADLVPRLDELDGSVGSEDESWGLVSGVVGGNLNKDKGWKGDNVTLLSPEAGGIYMYGHQAEKGDRIADPELQPEIDELVNQVSQWRDY